MAITIVDIAKRAGVTHPVVSKVLNGGGTTVGVSKPLREKILKIANEMEYRPHGASLALRKRSFRNVGVLMGSTSEFYLPQRMLASLTQTLSDHNYTCTLVCIREFDVENLRSNPLIKSHLVDVLLIGYVYEPPGSVVRFVEQKGINSLWLNRISPTDAVFVDEADAAYQLVQHLYKCGQRRISYIDHSGSGTDNPVTANRLRGFDLAAKELGVETAYMVHRRVPRGRRVESAREWLSPPNHPSAVIVNSFASAQTIMQAAFELGMRIPDDLAIASFDNGMGWKIPEPAITCAIHPEQQFGQIAAKLALKKARNPLEVIQSCGLKYSLAVGGSTTGQ